MEPTIYKPSIYKGAGIYKNGAGGGVENELFREQIKDNFYTYVKIGNLYFTIENLREDFTGIAHTYSSGNPYRLNVSGWDILGFYYNDLSFDVIKQWFDNNSDWRIATKEDFLTLVNYELKTLKAPIVWNNPEGNTNQTDFTCLGGGYYAGEDYREFGINAYFATTTRDNNKKYYVQINNDNERNVVVANTYDNPLNAWNIRLVKDA